ncbi:MAG: 6-bladed beta-propeller [Bacteroidia bacterium]|nr:6-bladed beta-propeller [Bacteroidia bacterium]
MQSKIIDVLKYWAIPGLMVVAACTGNHLQQPQQLVPAMDLSTITDTITIDLDHQINDYQIVPLETTPTLLIGDGAKFIFISDDYILVETETGLQQFNKQGRFIRQLMSKGKGPDEFIYLGAVIIYKSGLYFTDVTKSRERIYSCNLSTGDLTSFPLAISGIIDDLAFLNDSTLMVISDKAGEKGWQCTVFVQDLKGNLSYSKGLGNYDLKSRIGHAHIQPDGTGGALFSNPKSDSIVRFTGSQFQPWWYTLNLSEFVLGQTYERFLRIVFLYCSKGDLFFEKTLISSAKKTTKFGHRQLVAVSPDSLKAAIVRSFRIKDLDFDIDPFINYQSKTFAVAEYSAIDFKEKIRAIMARNDLVGTDKSVRDSDKSVREKLKALDQKITENDNPVLIIWKL